MRELMSICFSKRFFSEAIALAKKQQLQQIDNAERAAIARAFNDRYTFRKEYVLDQPRLPGTSMYGLNPRSGFAWMCPECNKVHHPTKCSVFGGLQYPACCKTAEGHRLSHEIRTK